MSVHPENAATYSAGNEGQKICGVFSENAPLLTSSGVAVVFHTFRWPFFFTAKVVRMRIDIHSYAYRTAGEYPACRGCARRTNRARALAYIVHETPRNACSMRRGFCTLVLFIGLCVCVCVCVAYQRLLCYKRSDN